MELIKRILVYFLRRCQTCKLRQYLSRLAKQIKTWLK